MSLSWVVRRSSTPSSSESVLSSSEMPPRMPSSSPSSPRTAVSRLGPCPPLISPKPSRMVAPRELVRTVRTPSAARLRPPNIVSPARMRRLVLLRPL